MSRLRVPTAVNRHASVHIEKAALQQWRTVYRDALAPMGRLAQRETVTPAQALAALRALRRARTQLEELEYVMLGAAVLGDRARIDDISRRTGIAGSTLTRRLRHSPAHMRGLESMWDASAPWQWRLA